MLKEFREFISKGNLIELVVAFVLGLAFAGVVASFTKVVLGAISYVFGGKVSFDQFSVHRGAEVVIPYGAFLTDVVSFLIVAFALFLVVKAYNKLRRATPSVPSAEVTLLTEIRDELRTD